MGCFSRIPLRVLMLWYSAAVLVLWAGVMIWRFPATTMTTEPPPTAAPPLTGPSPTEDGDTAHLFQPKGPDPTAASPFLERIRKRQESLAAEAKLRRDQARHQAPQDPHHEEEPAGTDAAEGIPTTRRWQPSSAGTQTNLDEERRGVVREMLRTSWKAYRTHAWGFDEYCPVSGRANNWGQGRGIGSTIVDALDTLLIAGLDEEADEAIQWVEESLSYAQSVKLSFFETTIRVVGGLLSTFQITGRPKVLQQALDISRRMLPAFDTPVGLPDNYVNLLSGAHEGAGWNGGAAILSEFGSLQMEYFTLSKVAPRDAAATKLWEKARAAVEFVEPSCGSGYCPRQFKGRHGQGAQAGLGSFGDSFYEYLLKQWILSGKKDDLFKRMWEKAAKHTITTSTTQQGFLIPNGQETGGVMEHLACFSGGLFALSYIHTNNTEHLSFAKRVAETCHGMYNSTRTGLAPDVATVGAGGHFRASEPKYILRPETVETYFYLWKATKDPKYRDWGFEVVTAINTHLKLSNGRGYAGARNVEVVPVAFNDNMETFWFAETLKYLYLLFSEDEKIDLEKWVFNTEAHPMRVREG